MQKQQSMGEAAAKESVNIGSSSTYNTNRYGPLQTQHEVQPKMPPIRRNVLLSFSTLFSYIY